MSKRTNDEQVLNVLPPWLYQINDPKLLQEGDGDIRIIQSGKIHPTVRCVDALRFPAKTNLLLMDHPSIELQDVRGALGNLNDRRIYCVDVPMLAQDLSRAILEHFLNDTHLNKPPVYLVPVPRAGNRIAELLLPMLQTAANYSIRILPLEQVGEMQENGDILLIDDVVGTGVTMYGTLKKTQEKKPPSCRILGAASLMTAYLSGGRTGGDLRGVVRLLSQVVYGGVDVRRVPANSMSTMMFPPDDNDTEPEQAKKAWAVIRDLDVKYFHGRLGPLILEMIKKDRQ